jgi:hypothetical protein
LDFLPEEWQCRHSVIEQMIAQVFGVEFRAGVNDGGNIDADENDDHR